MLFSAPCKESRLVWFWSDRNGNDMRRRIFADVEMVCCSDQWEGRSNRCDGAFHTRCRREGGLAGGAGSLGRQRDGDVGTVGRRAFFGGALLGMGVRARLFCWPCPALAALACCFCCFLLLLLLRLSAVSPLPPVHDPESATLAINGLADPGDSRAWANDSRTRRVFPESRLQGPGGIRCAPAVLRTRSLARSVASKRSPSTRQISQRRAGVVPVSCPRPLRRTASYAGPRGNKSSINAPSRPTARRPRMG